MKRLTLTLSIALLLALTLVLPSLAYDNQPQTAAGAGEMSAQISPDQGSFLQASITQTDGRNLVAGKGDDDEHDHDKDDKHDDHDKNDQHDDHDKDGQHHDQNHDQDHHQSAQAPDHDDAHQQHHELRGRIEAMDGNVWTIDGRTVMITERTRLETEHGPMEIGAMVEVKATLQADGSYLAEKIELKERKRDMTGPLATPNPAATPGAQMRTQTRTQAQMQTMTQQQIKSAEQQQALQMMSAIIQWLMQTFDLDLSQMLDLLNQSAQ